MEEVNALLTLCLLWATLLVAQGQQTTTTNNQTADSNSTTTAPLSPEEVYPPIPWAWFVVGMIVGAIILPCMTAFIMKICGCCVTPVSRGGYDPNWNPADDIGNNSLISRFHSCGVTGVGCGVTVLIVLGAGFGAVFGVLFGASLQ